MKGTLPAGKIRSFISSASKAIAEEMEVFLNDVLGWKLQKTAIALAIIISILISIRIWFPPYRFDRPLSTVVFDRNGEMLGARIAGDGQWRFPAENAVADKFKTCLLQFEDQHFYHHPGFNPLSIARAAFQNIMAGKTVSGGSTITMQLIRISREGRKRNIPQKLIEVFLSVYAEIRFDKDQILRQYASVAPYGGNIVGLEAAAWRYFGRSADNLSWAESACLAILPNSPAMIHPGRNREVLKVRRDKLLFRLHQKKYIDRDTYELAVLEPIPDKPQPLPETAPHLVDRLASENGKQLGTSINASLQKQVSRIVERHHQILESNPIHNAAVLVLDTRSGEVLAYVGNTKKVFKGDHSNQVDIIRRPRSSGSLLKPFLYSAMLSEGEIMPSALIPDIPTTISNFTPKNFNSTCDGAVPASDALIRSLNIPAVRMLSNFGLQRFYNVLHSAGFSTITRSADHYGLSLILGGAEVTLWDVCAAYRAMAVKLQQFDGQLHTTKQIPNQPNLVNDSIETRPIAIESLDEAAIYLTFEAMREVMRPEEEAGWDWFRSSSPVAWKTGTSFGFRDAWSVGVTPDFVVGVWVGNADGEGRPGLTGIQTAAPVMFEVFGQLHGSGKWFDRPWDKMEKVAVCRQSGMRLSPFCTEADSIWVNKAALNSPPCPYHKLIHLDETEQFRVNADCYPSEKIISKSWFELPPAMAWYYKARNPFYRSTPPWLPQCQTGGELPMQIVWPDKPSKVFIPRELDGSMGEVVFEIAHSIPESTIFWYLNDEFLGQTSYIHKKGIRNPPGNYKLVLMDESGNILSQAFEIVNR